MNSVCFPRCLAFMLTAFHSPLIGADPVLTSPGTATWESFQIDGGSRMVVTVHDDTVLSWDTFRLEEGSELVFDFLGGSSVANHLGGGSPHVIAGTITGNGGLSFFSSGAPLVVTGAITAESVELGALGSEGVGASSLLVSGVIEATAGSVSLAAPDVVVFREGVVRATERIVLAGCERMEVNSLSAEGVAVSGDRGVVLNVGRLEAPEVVAKAVKAFHNSGSIGSEGGVVFIEVGATGQISTGISAVMHGSSWVSGRILRPEETRVEFHEGDGLAVVGEGTLTIPTVRHPNGTEVASRRPIRFTTAMSASGDVSRDRRNGAEPEKARPVETGRALMRRSSFFGMRGGSATLQLVNSTSRQ